jgi:MFS family permease
MSLAVMIVLSVFVYTVQVGSRMTITLTTLNLTHSEAIAGVMGSVFSLMPILVGLFAGKMIDRFGTLKPAAVAVALSLVGLMVPFAHPSILTLTVACVAQGASFITVAMALTNGGAMLGRVQDRTRNLSWLYLGNSAGMSVGPLVAGFGIDHVGHRGTFGLLAILPVVSLTLLITMRHRFPNHARPPKAASGRLIDLLRDHDLRSLIIVQALINLSLETFYFMVPLHGTQVGLSASMIGTVLSCAFVSNFISRAMVPTMVRRFGEVKMMSAVFMIVGAWVAPLGNVTAPAVLMLLAGGVGITHGMIFPALTSMFYGASPQGRQGEVSGIRTMAGNSTTSCAQLVAGALSASVGIAPVMWVVGASSFFAAWFVRRNVREPTHLE